MTAGVCRLGWGASPQCLRPQLRSRLDGMRQGRGGKVEGCWKEDVCKAGLDPCRVCSGSLCLLAYSCAEEGSHARSLATSAQQLSAMSLPLAVPTNFARAKYLSRLGPFRQPQLVGLVSPAYRLCLGTLPTHDHLAIFRVLMPL